MNPVPESDRGPARPSHAPLGPLELRVHGVRGSSPEELLDVPGVVRAAGDGLAGFWRPAAPRDGLDREAYVWGDLTTGRRGQALWLLLLPFTLLNVSGWMIPPPETLGHGRAHVGTARVAMARGLVRLLAVLLTLQFVLWTGLAAIDLIAYQCGGSAACLDAHAWLGWLDAGLLAGRPMRRVALGALVPVALIAFLAYLGRRTTQRYEAFGDLPPERVKGEDAAQAAPTLQGAPPPAGPETAEPAGAVPGASDDDHPLTRREFWRNTRIVRAMGALHVAAALAVVAMLVGAARVALGGDPAAGGTMPTQAWPVRAAFWDAAPAVLIAASAWLVVLLLIATFAGAWDGWLVDRPAGRRTLARAKRRTLAWTTEPSWPWLADLLAGPAPLARLARRVFLPGTQPPDAGGPTAGREAMPPWGALALRWLPIALSTALVAVALADAWSLPAHPLIAGATTAYGAGGPPALGALAQAPYGLLGAQMVLALVLGFMVHGQTTTVVALSSFGMGIALQRWFPQEIHVILLIAAATTITAGALAVRARLASSEAREVARWGTPVILANLGVILTNVTFGGVSIGLAGWLGTAEGYHGPATEPVAADAILYSTSSAWLSLGFMAIAGTLMVAAAVVALGTWLLEARPALGRLAGQYDADAAAQHAGDPLRIDPISGPAARWSWTARPIRWWWLSRLLDDADMGAWLLSALGASFPVAAWVYLIASQGVVPYVGLWEPLPALDGAQACFVWDGRRACLPSFLTPTAAAFTAVLPVWAMIFLIRRASSDAVIRRTVGILWDIGTFWPRRFHPLAPPCYAERTVPELADRLVDIAIDSPRPVLLAAHSQGTVLAAAAVALLAGDARLDRPADQALADLTASPRDPAAPAWAALQRLSLLTMGSPLGRFYGRYFPAFCNDALCGIVERALTRDDPPEARWRNAFRATDYIGGPIVTPRKALPPDAVTAPSTSDPAAPIDVQLRDPYRRWYRRDQPVPEPQNHGGYFDDDAEIDALRAALT